MKSFLLLWSTQALSVLGSDLTSFALTLWVFAETGSALRTALLSVCSYVPYVLISIFAGALTDKWDKKKTMLTCDILAAICTVSVLVLYSTGTLRPWYLYLINAISGLMNTVQRPASDVAVTLLTPEGQFQMTSGLRSFSSSVNMVLHPIVATALYSIGGLYLVIAVDLATFLLAFLVLAFLITVPETGKKERTEQGSVLVSAAEGLRFLKENRLVLYLMLFLSGVNFVASAFDSVLPAYILPLANGGEKMLGRVVSTAGLAMVAGSLIVTFMPAPKDRVRTILYTMLFSLTTDNFLLSLSRSPAVWCIAQVMGYILVPVMSSNLDVIIRTSIPVEIQGRVYACRNTLQFFTIPVGQFLGGLLVDRVCEPYMAAAGDGFAARCFGSGPGSGAAMMIFILGIVGFIICAVFIRILNEYKYPQ